MRRMIVLFCLVSLAAVLPAQNAYDRTTPISEVAEDPVVCRLVEDTVSSNQ